MASITMDTPVGPFTILARDEQVLASGFTADVEALLPLVPPAARTPGDADLDRITKAAQAYFDGDLTAIDAIAVEQRGGPFLTEAWAALRKVPAGAPVTYTGFAAVAGRPAAVRAAAQACARNAAALFVPCHRVVRTDGTLGGYRWGIEVKRWLLAHERETGS
ncbi:MAG: methylated-DNA--protein-cysteine methyltransferase [Actinobacteria bacterium 13_2_20CM_2_71_6]|nr:MAG: methylated-DNA--protein-cysteine methyltransferase [Actinobacteria bacterium 13_2_20CM_2_71_6]